jgi:threonine/homoserine/homoserine lactone efflux protein
MESLLLKGFLIGFSIAAPVGPIGALCIKRSIIEGQRAGLVTGLGAASADAVYGLIAAFGLTAITSFLVGQHFWFGLLGGIFLCYLSYKTFISEVKVRDEQESPISLGKAYLSTFGLTLTNPMTIISFIAVFTGLGLASQSRSPTDPLVIVVGVFIGSAFWWLILSGLSGWFGKRLNNSTLRWVNYVSGIIIGLFGIVAIFQALQ